MKSPNIPMSHFALTLDGKPASAEAMDAMLSCSIEGTLNLPDMCLLRLHDEKFRWIDSPLFREGVTLMVSVGWEGKDSTPLFRGEIVGLEMDLDATHMTTLSIRAYDRSHRLHRGRQSRTFVQMTDADIVSKIGKELGFTVKAKPTPIVHEWLMQRNQTNWEFLQECAARCGYRLFVKEEKELNFQPVDYTSQTTTLEWGTELIHFRPRLTTSKQVDTVIVHGWNPQMKQTILGQGQAAQGVPVLGLQGEKAVQGGNEAKRLFGAATYHLVDHPIQTQQEADTLAQSLCDAFGSQYIEAEGTATGNTKLQPGTWVEIKNIGERFSGKYFITTTRHVYGTAQKGGAYQTHFQVTGKQPPILLGLLESHVSGGEANGSANQSIVIGVVTDNNDPEGMGRVKVNYPWLTEQHTSHWARCVSPMAGKGRGFFFLPEVGDEVLVAFEQGSITRPYLLGSLWNGKDSTVEPNNQAVSGDGVNRRTLKTRIGHTILLDDTGGKGGVEVHTKDGRIVTLSDAEQKITLSDKAGNSVTVNTGDSSIKMVCNGNFSVAAKGSVSIEGIAGVSVSSPAQTEVKGTNVSVTGNAAVSVTGTAAVNITGGIVAIN